MWDQSIVPCPVLTVALDPHTGFSGDKQYQSVWDSHLLKNFPQFDVIYTVKGFSAVSEAEVDVFLEFPCFFYDNGTKPKKSTFYTMEKENTKL